MTSQVLMVVVRFRTARKGRVKKRENRQIFGVFIASDAKNVTFQLQFLCLVSESGKHLTNVCCQCRFLRGDLTALLLFERRADLLPQGAGRPHRLERAGDDLRGARAVRVVGRFGVHQFGVGQNDPKLIVQAVEEKTQLRHLVHVSPRRARFSADDAPHQAWFRPSACHGAGVGVVVDRPSPLASRHNVSTKIRTDPPAVRTYSILPLDNQL